MDAAERFAGERIYGGPLEARLLRAEASGKENPCGGLPHVTDYIATMAAPGFRIIKAIATREMWCYAEVDVD
jgi:hypothetical protein